MIAKVYIGLPFLIALPENEKLTSTLLEVAGEGMDVRLGIPMRGRHLELAKEQEVFVTDRTSFAASVFVMEFLSESFIYDHIEEFTPSKDVIENAANFYLDRLRAITDSSSLRPIRLDRTSWRINYLNNDGTPVLGAGRNPAQYIKAIVEFRATPVDSRVWDACHSVPVEWRMDTWRALLLDARFLLPEIGPAIILAFSALEVFVNTVLDKMAERSGLSQKLWKFIKSEDDYVKAPSIADKFGKLLPEICNIEITEEHKDAFTRLKKVRNNCVHRGVPAESNSDLNPIDLDTAAQLIRKTGDIIEFIRASLPDDVIYEPSRVALETRFTHTIKIGGNDSGEDASNES